MSGLSCGGGAGLRLGKARCLVGCFVKSQARLLAGNGVLQECKVGGGLDLFTLAHLRSLCSPLT